MHGFDFKSYAKSETAGKLAQIFIENKNKRITTLELFDKIE